MRSGEEAATCYVASVGALGKRFAASTADMS